MDGRCCRTDGGAVVAIDGKTLRRSLRKAGNKAAIHMVSAFAADNSVVLGQVKTAEKSNSSRPSITAIPELLTLLRLKGCLVTIDTMGCQRDIAEQIIVQGSDYLLAVKGNQPTLEEIVEEPLEWGVEEDVTTVGGSYASDEEWCAGREIMREVWVMPSPDDLFELDAWKGLRSMILAQRTVTEESGEQTVGRRLYISSKSPKKANKLLKAVRQHWSIENTLHWSLDVAFDEDRSRIRAENSAENIARLRHIAINLLKQEKTAKVGIKIKRGMAGWDDSYLLKVLGL